MTVRTTATQLMNAAAALDAAIAATRAAYDAFGAAIAANPHTMKGDALSVYEARVDADERHADFAEAVASASAEVRELIHGLEPDWDGTYTDLVFAAENI